MVRLFYITQVFALFFLLVVLNSFIKTPRFKYATCLLSSLFLTLESVSLYLTGNLVDFRFYANLDIGEIISVIDLFLKEFTFGVILFLLLSYLFYLSRKFLYDKVKKKWVIKLLILPIVITLFIPGGAFYNIYEIIAIKHSPKYSFEESLEKLGIQLNEYPIGSKIEAEPGKNIIVLTLESVESGFISDDFKEQMPNLCKLRNTEIYFNMIPTNGANWTSASIYTTLTGFPAYFKDNGNEIFKKTIESKITGLPNVLKKAGYDISYMIGNPNYSGILDLLNTYDVNVISEETVETKYETHSWGFHDKDLFTEAKKQLLEKKKNNKQFALFLTTISTHMPNGIYDPRMEGIIPKQRSTLEFMAAALDHHIGDFINFIKDEDLLSNTVFYIVPDHLLMSTTARVLSDFKEERSLYLITNTDCNNLSYNKSESIYQIDLPKIILEGAEIKHNAKFLTDFILQEDKNKYIEDNKENILSLNHSSLVRYDNSRQSFYNFYDNVLGNTKQKLNMDTIIINSVCYNRLRKEVVYKTIQTSKSVELKTGINIIKLGNEKSLEVSRFIDIDDFLTNISTEVKEKEFFVLAIVDSFDIEGEVNLKYLRTLDFNKIVTLKKGEAYICFSNAGFHREIIAKNDTFIKLPVAFTHKHLTQDTIEKVSNEKERFIAHAGGEVDGYKYTNSLEALNNSYKKGFRLFELDIIKTSDGEYVAAHDWDYWAENVGYNDIIPVSLEVFLKYKMYKQFTPLSMQGINKWFKEHPDAILVTDKINEPKEFSKRFIDKTRLMMELFSWEAVKEGIDAEIKSSMPSQNIIDKLEGDKVRYLTELNIKNISVSRNYVDNNTNFMQRILDKGIKSYIFHINQEVYKDEAYAVSNDMKYAYGIYADNWSFE